VTHAPFFCSQRSFVEYATTLHTCTTCISHAAHEAGRVMAEAHDILDVDGVTWRVDYDEEGTPFYVSHA
jgi:hypothetical protein